jgi:hypothetical protein
MTDQPLSEYKSLDDIRAHKEALRKVLQRERQSMKTHWDGLFHKPDANLPSRRISTLMTTGASVFDGIILVWKLYNRFGGGKRTAKKTKKGSKGFLASLFS